MNKSRKDGSKVMALVHVREASGEGRGSGVRRGRDKVGGG